MREDDQVLRDGSGAANCALIGTQLYCAHENSSSDLAFALGQKMAY